jgi:hypothetical protein
MRPQLIAALTVGLFFSLAWRGPAQDDEVRALLERGIQALGGAERIQKQQAGRLKTKGRLEILGGVDSTQETAYQVPNKFRQQLDMEINGQKVTVVTVYDGKKGAIDVNGQKLPPDDKITGVLKDAAYQMQVGRLVSLKEKGYELSTLGETQVNGKPALGIRVVKQGYPDVNLFFDKEKGLPVKVESRTVDFMSGVEVTEERIIREYQMLDGAPVPRRVEVRRDGKLFMDAEVLEVKYLEKIEDAEFALP